MSNDDPAKAITNYVQFLLCLSYSKTLKMVTCGKGTRRYMYSDAPQAITGDRVNRECYVQVRGRVHNSHLGACFCIARL